MLEGLAAWVINNYLGKYVENLNTDQLSIALLQGAVELENLPLRKDALRHVGLPIEVRAGFIGRVKLKIPISQITSAPWEIVIEKLYVVAGPIKLSELDVDAEEQALVDYKLSELDGIEACWRAEGAATESGYYASYSSWLGLSMSFATNIIENLQLKIRDVHIRFEDDVTMDNDEMFACGIRVEQLSAQSCDSSWLPKFVSAATESYKLIEMTGFCVYWDKISSSEMCSSLSLSQLSEVMKSGSSCGPGGRSHEYLLSPVSAEARIKRNRSEVPLRSRQTPRIVCDLTLNRVPLNLIQWQYSQMVRCKKGLEWISRRRNHLRYRPRKGAKDDPIAWWRYACRRAAKYIATATSFCSESGTANSGATVAVTWIQALSRARDNIRYVSIYSKLLITSSATAPLIEEDRIFKDKMEWQLDFYTLKGLREAAMRKARPTETVVSSKGGSAVQQQPGLSILASWFPGWWGWHQGSSDAVETKQLSSAKLTSPDMGTNHTPTQLDDQILDALADTVENNTLLKRDTVFGHFNFTLKKGTLNICQTDRVGVIELQFENVKLGYESRPRTASHWFNLTLGAIYLNDRYTKDSAFPVLISPQKSDSLGGARTSGTSGRNLSLGLAKLLSQQTSGGNHQTSPSSPSSGASAKDEPPLFSLTYEYKPFNSNADNKLLMKSKSLDIVYNPGVVKWIVDFFTGPYFEPSLRRAARKGYHAMKMKTKKQILNNWESILQGQPNNRKSWDVELDISAPQIFLVEHFNDKDAVLCLIDFGKLHFTNRILANGIISEKNVNDNSASFDTTEEDEDEAFQTPCSTPPGSVAEDTFTVGSPKSPSYRDTNLDESILHNRLYDRYVLNFCELQILVGRVRDNWKFAHLKGTSTLHVLDKFNISLQIERRVVYTVDPQFPSLTVSGNLPKLVVHVNEQKVCALKTLADVVSGKGLISPVRSNEGTPLEENKTDAMLDNLPQENDSSDTSARLVMLQFCVDQMALEVQSRGRSVAELQVSGVRLSFIKRPYDTSLSLSVHSLLLVDALQNFGQDFELLLASHKHVGMDTVSGSLQDSEPTSPTSPASPEPDIKFPKVGPTSPIAISQAISSLNLQHRAKSPVAAVSPPPLSLPLPPPPLVVATELPDSEALITVELLFVSADCPTNSSNSEHLQVASIQFNNLDIIANQETIVELMGFVKRIFPKDSTNRPSPPSPLDHGFDDTTASCSLGGGDDLMTGSLTDGEVRSPGDLHSVGLEKSTRTQVTFDFHRLNILLLRAVAGESGGLQARKIATATMTDAKVHANIGKIIEVDGSLGGLQVLDLTPGGAVHRRILSVGDDPLAMGAGRSSATSSHQHSSLSSSANNMYSNRLLACMAREMYSMGGSSVPPSHPSPVHHHPLHHHHNHQAFSFSIKRTPVNSETDIAEISIRMASVWYTHSPKLLLEVSCCAAEFKQYLSNVAKSIGSAATEVAIGLINVRTESLAERLSMGGRLYGSSSDISQTPRRFRSISYSSEFLDFTRGNNSPTDSSDTYVTLIKWDVLLASPVVVMPRSWDSKQVVVAHLGSISITNQDDSGLPCPGGGSTVSSPWGPPSGAAVQRFSLSISHISLYTVDITTRVASFSNVSEQCVIAAERLYSCSSEGKPVLHDTSIQVSILRQFGKAMNPVDQDILLDSWQHSPPADSINQLDSIQVTGRVITPLKLSLSREQYEQILDTVDVLLTSSGTDSSMDSGSCNGMVPGSNTPIANASGSGAGFSVSSSNCGSVLADIVEDVELATGVSTLSLDPALRARMMLQSPASPRAVAHSTHYHSSTNAPAGTQHEVGSHHLALAVSFELPEFCVELVADLGVGEKGLVDLSFTDLIVQFDKSHNSLVNIQVSVRSVTMEDLQQPNDSKYRFLMSSSSSSSSRPEIIPTFHSRSCPDFPVPIVGSSVPWHYSLPDHLETEHVLGVKTINRHKHILAVENSLEKRRKYSNDGAKCPYTPPPSPRGHSSPPIFHEDNLVHVNVTYRPGSQETQLRQQNASSSGYSSSQISDKHNWRSVTVDFNSLDVIVNVESWVVVLDFFGISDMEQEVKQQSSVDATDNSTATLVQDSLQQSADLSGNQAALDPSNLQKSKTENDLHSETEVSVRSLTLLLNRAEYEVGRVAMGGLKAILVTPVSGPAQTTASVASFTLSDLTPQHSTLYRHRFITAGLSLTMNKYNAPPPAAVPAAEGICTGDGRNLMSPDLELKMEMTSLVYVHTRRYIEEILAFFRLFPHLRKRIGYTKGNEIVEDDENTVSTRLLLELSAVSPIILLPVSSQSLSVLVADLGNLEVSNRLLMSGSPGTIGISSDPARNVLLDVMSIELESMDLLTGERKMDITPTMDRQKMIPVGSYYIERKGTSLLREKCHLSVHVERNLMPGLHCVADLSIRGTLSALAADITLTDYKLISGLLSYNIGECIDDIQPQADVVAPFDPHNDVDIVWTCTSLRFELVDVNVQLLPTEDTSLACINFIKSVLLIETYSNRSQDIDLVSEEILISDTRYKDLPFDKKPNVFTNILQPIHMVSDSDTVQAQVHHRKRLDLSKFTILLNNMRLMAIFDWWDAVQSFVLTKPDHVPSGNFNQAVSESYNLPADDGGDVPFELKLNITDSEIVILEDTSQTDSNAVILKSTTVITYRPLEIDKPVSCNLNHCEMFSCILGMEDETALSIIDPITVNVDILTRQNSDNGHIYKVLKVQMIHLSLRLSYYDVRMFSQMLTSIPKQTTQARAQSNDMPHSGNMKSQLDKLKNLGFVTDDCVEALKVCEGKLDDAALWLTQHGALNAPNSASSGFLSGAIGAATSMNSPFHLPGNVSNMANSSPFSFDCIEVDTDSIEVVLIDDCRDADVPLLEVSLTGLEVKHSLDTSAGSSSGSLLCHYYNRLLSGWEPFIEPWRFSLTWEYTLSFAMTKTRLELHIASADALLINITSSLIELYKSVRDTWTEDFYNGREGLSVSSNGRESGDLKSVSSFSVMTGMYRRRSPFVPFAMNNDTGSTIWYTTLISAPDKRGAKWQNCTSENQLNWVRVEPGNISPFSFNEQGKVRHRDTHKLRSHQIYIRVDGWKPVGPITVDKVGIFFRTAYPDWQSNDMDLPQARVVLEVTLEGSARKLITVRSSLQIRNQLPNSVEIRLDNPHLKKNRSVHRLIPENGHLSVPMLYTNASIWARPCDISGQPLSRPLAYCTRPIEWSHVTQSNQSSLETRVSHVNNSNNIYRFCVSVKREGYPGGSAGSGTSTNSVNVGGVTIIGSWLQPAHTISLLSPLTVINLLPYELHCSINKDIRVRIKPGQEYHLHQVDVDNKIELGLHLDNFPQGGTVEIPPTPQNYSNKVRLHDHTNRSLLLQVSGAFDSTSALRINISAPYWFINKTALPIVFKQEGVQTETAGQYEEHEIARMVAPLLFSTTSFSENDTSPTVVARIGSAVHPEGVPQWCSSIPLQTGVRMRRLKVSLRDNRPDLVYMIGVEIRPGRGRYRATKIVTLSAHYQIHNKSTYSLQFSQKCFATTISDPGANATYLTTVPNCSLPFHWPRLDKDQLLCVRILDIPQCLWSGGFKIDDNNSFHINIRDVNGRMYFLRVEVVLQGATYFILTMDADTMPPPIRIDNFSKVSLQFHQVGLSTLSYCVKPQNQVAYAWDEPTYPPRLTVTAPGGVSADYNLNKLGEGPLLTYENFIYITFTGTFNNNTSVATSSPSGVARAMAAAGGGFCSSDGMEDLVLDVPEVTSGRVVLSKKQPGARSQLWRMTAEGQLQHEGSSPPRASPDKILVLDICGPAIQPMQYTGLMVRRPDKRRSCTQSWRFTEDGRLCCAHSNMCVQAKDGFFGITPGNEVVLGPPRSPFINQNQDHQRRALICGNSIPIEEAVSRQRLRPGSGFLALEVASDGPTRVLKITDVKEKNRVFLTTQDDGGWITYNVCSSDKSQNSSTTPSTVDNSELQLTLELPKLSVSLVSQWPHEELIFVTFDGIRVSSLMTPLSQLFDIAIQEIQMDNQQFDAQIPVVFFVTPSSRSSDPDEAAKPVISITAERTPTKRPINVDIFKYLLVKIKSISTIIDERLALKLLIFCGLHEEEEVENTDESDFEMQRILAEAASVHSKRYYFDSLKLFFTQVRLSVLTSNKLPKRLLSVKKKLGWTLIRFEDAAIDLQPFIRQYCFESGQFLWNSMLKHYKNEMKWQAGIILGSVDFLGNPLGFVNDISEGMSGLLDGNLKALVRNVAHGLSNSTAKFTETLGDGLGRVSLDESYEEARQRIRSVEAAGGSSGDHLIAGLKGFGIGLLGGMTSIFKQSYDGAAQDGFPGFISGIGKGIVGTVTKPVVGVLDLASETASAARDYSKSSSKRIPNRKRLPRCVLSAAGFLPIYNLKQSQGQQFLYSINSRNYKELFVAYEVLSSSSDERDLRLIISSNCIRVFTCTHNDPMVVLDKNLSDLVECNPVTQTDSSGKVVYYIELLMRVTSDGSSNVGVTGGGGPTVLGGAGSGPTEPLKRPKVRCQSDAISNWVSQQINYAKSQFIERQHTLIDYSEASSED